MRILRALGKLLLLGATVSPLAAVALVAFAAGDGVQARGYKVLHTFSRGTDGFEPGAGVIRDAAGNLYGTTEYGGTGSCDCGVVFRLAPDGRETVLHSFAGGNDGYVPSGPLLMDAAGSLYGTTFGGGSKGYGTVYRIDSKNSETILYSFAGPPDGSEPFAGVIIDHAGNLYGTTGQGGTGGCAGGCGTVFELASDGTETVLYDFDVGTGGYYATTALLMDPSGNIFGTTGDGGDAKCGCGTLFEFASGAYSVLHAFTGGADGAGPSGNLVMDASGSLYGTTMFGGGEICHGFGSGCGILFKLAPDGTYTVLHRFGKRAGGPQDLVMDKRGNFYGSTNSIGNRCGGYACSTVFRLGPNGALRVLEKFDTQVDPHLVSTAGGRLYGSTSMGGANAVGTVFRIDR